MIYQFFEGEEVALELGAMSELGEIGSQLDGRGVIILVVELNCYEVMACSLGCHIVNLYF